MTLPNNQLREISLCKDLEEERTRTVLPNVPRIYNNRQSRAIESSIKQEGTLDKKRKRGEPLKFQGRHGQLAIDSARATEMDYFRFSEAFSGFNYTSANTYACDDHFRDTGKGGVFHPRMHDLENGIAFHDTDYDCAFYENRMPASSDLVWSLPGDTLVPGSLIPETSAGCGSSYRGSIDGDGVDFKHKDAHDEHTTSAIPAEDSDFSASESEEESSRKTLKINKDGAPRKPRQPRPKLLKWSDDDWKNVCLGIVWACGETGVQIPFDQAAQVVGEKCTAGALQQALLKLRGKQIAEGHQIPNLKMAWTRKNKYAASTTKAKSSQEPEPNRPRKRPTRMEATQSYLVTLPRAYSDQDREGMAFPYKWKRSPRKANSSMLRNSTNVEQKGSAETSTSSYSFINDLPQHQSTLGPFTYTQPGMTQTTHPSIEPVHAQTHLPVNFTRSSRTLTPNREEGIQGDSTIYDYAHWFEHPGMLTTSQDPEHPPATPMTGQQLYNSPPATPFGNNTGYIQGMVVSSVELASLITENLHEYGNSFAGATDDVFAT